MATTRVLSKEDGSLNTSSIITSRSKLYTDIDLTFTASLLSEPKVHTGNLKINGKDKVLIIFTITLVVPSMAQDSSYSDLIKAGLLGAGAGAVGGAASGGKGDDIWKGALAGAGINIIGGALLDAISGGNTSNRSYTTQSQRYYYTQQPQVQTYTPPVQTSREAYSMGYQEGYQAGYAAGYREGYEEGLKEVLRR